MKQDDCMCVYISIIYRSDVVCLPFCLSVLLSLSVHPSDCMSVALTLLSLFEFYLTKFSYNNTVFVKTFRQHNHCFYFKEYMSDSVTNYIYVGNTKVSVLIKKTNASKCTF